MWSQAIQCDQSNLLYMYVNYMRLQYMDQNRIHHVDAMGKTFCYKDEEGQNIKSRF